MRKTLTSWSLLLGVLAWLIAALPALAQTGGGTITGRVLDPKGEPVIGATVLVQGTTKGAATDVDGSFTIREVPAGAYTVAVSSVGMNTYRQQVTVTDGGTTSVAAAMTDNAAQLAEAVVVGYGTVRRQEVTGSVATVSSKDFVQGQVTNPANLIVGKVAGVVVTPPSGAPGSSSPITIRGLGSLNASTAPLIVIDGVPTDNTGISGAPDALSLINPNDIETFTVLKDASATAIYGSRAAGGVILITTKKGLANEKLHVNFSTQFSVAENYRTIKTFTGDEFRAFIRNTDTTGFAAGTGRSPAYVATEEQLALLGSANTDWQKEIFRRAYTSDNNLSITGSLGSVPVRASVGYLNQQGTLRGGNLKRNSASISLTPTLLDNHLRIDVNAKGVLSDNIFANEGAIGAAVAFDPTQSIRTSDPRYAQYGGYFQWINPVNDSLIGLAPLNPVALLEQRRDRSTVYRGIGNVQLDYKMHFLPDLRANLNLGYDIARSAGTTTIPVDAASNIYTGGSFNEYQQKKDNKLLEAYLNYAKTLGTSGLRVDATAGYSYQDFRFRTPTLPRARRVSNGDFINAKDTASLASDVGYTLISFFGRANVNFKDRYLLTGTLRNDRSSRFGPDNRSGYFSALSAAWRIKGENFLASSTLISDLKLRVGYGETGQQDLFGNYYPYLALYQQGIVASQYQLGNTFSNTLLSGGYNSNLTWETTSTYNAGLDFGFFDNRLFGSVDVYQRESRDLLAEVDYPTGSNLTNKLIANIGTLRNRGVEVALTGVPVRTETITWSINGNLTVNRNELTELNGQNKDFLGYVTGGVAGGTGTNVQINSVGHPLQSFYVANQPVAANGTPIQQVQDSVVQLISNKSPNPKFTYGFGSTLAVQKFTFGFSAHGSVGNYVYNNVASDRGTYGAFLGNQSYLANGSTDVLNTKFNNNQNRSIYYVQKASFMRMDNITVGYDLSSAVSKLVNIRQETGTTATGNTGLNLRLTFGIQNVFVVTPYKGVDPEVAGGIDNNFYPRPRVFTLGLNVGF